MMTLPIILGTFALFVINFLISAANAYVAGQNWRFSKGLFVTPTAWLFSRGAYGMSVIGFSQTTLAVLLGIAKIGFGSSMPDQVASLAIDMWMVLIAIPLLGLGFWMTAQSVIDFVRKPSLLGGLSAAWNVGAMAHDVSVLSVEVPNALAHIGSAIAAVGTPSSDDDVKVIGGRMILAFALILLAAAAILAIGLTQIWFRKGAASEIPALAVA